ncbi:hypothetical protein NDU88_005222 [Pleurodeles waltl]|uniref:Uncharacterized protein n=1 Tax=Pleurodeles waltl TaxID=8319 RepID=A0AAV7L2I0_PLEWA|nr:hypothetical protein NDU88_005222 [Pleurodeles waltl]
MGPQRLSDAPCYPPVDCRPQSLVASRVWWTRKPISVVAEGCSAGRLRAIAMVPQASTLFMAPYLALCWCALVEDVLVPAMAPGRGPMSSHSGPRPARLAPRLGPRSLDEPELLIS